MRGGPPAHKDQIGTKAAAGCASEGGCVHHVCLPTGGDCWRAMASRDPNAIWAERLGGPIRR